MVNDAMMRFSREVLGIDVNGDIRRHRNWCNNWCLASTAIACPSAIDRFRLTSTFASRVKATTALGSSGHAQFWTTTTRS
jgi:hypothetical protein